MSEPITKNKETSLKKKIFSKLNYLGEFRALSQFSQKKIKILSAVILLASGSLLWKATLGTNNSQDLSRFTLQAESGRLPGTVTSSGELKAQRSVNVSPERQGILEELLVKEGDIIKKNELIARMKAGDIAYRLEEQKVEYEKQKAALYRRENLYIEGAISAEDYEDFRKSYLKSRARFNQIKVEGQDLEVLAPFDGVITARYAEPGSFVTPTTRASSSAGATSSSIVELSQGLEVSAKVPESDIGRIKINQNAFIRVDAYPDQRFQAKVTEIAPRAVKTNNVTSFEVTLLLEQEPKKLRIGMTADIEFQSGKSEITTLVPTVAIVTKKGEPGLLIVGKNKQPKFQEVELGISSGSKTAIIKGIKPGDSFFIEIPPWAKNKED